MPSQQPYRFGSSLVLRRRCWLPVHVCRGQVSGCTLHHTVSTLRIESC